jgi:hypothetical protein
MPMPAPASPRPSVGRIVLYRVSGADSSRLRANGATILPAMIVRVHDNGTVNLKVFCDGPLDEWIVLIEEGNAPGRWEWPNRN